MQGRRLQETGGVFAAIRRGFLGAENDADAGSSFAVAQQSSLFLVRQKPRASISLLWPCQPACTISAPSFALVIR
jgi:hypothetical protein